MASSEGPIVLYDGVCGLCNRFVQFVLRHDREAIFRFATLQSALALRVLEQHEHSQLGTEGAANGAPAAGLDTLYVVLGFGSESESLLDRSDAIAYVLMQLGGLWRLVARALAVLPHPVRNWAYKIVARNRYWVFGRYDTCLLPSEAMRRRFLDI